MNPFLATDGYKTGHHLMYPQGTSLVYSNFTPRSNKHAPADCDHVISFGQQMVMRQLQTAWAKNFFDMPKAEVCGQVKKEYSMYLNTDYDVSHIEALHDLGYLPIQVKTIREGSRVPMGCPVLTIKNTAPEFYWLTNFLETIISNLLWKPITSATIADRYKRDLIAACNRTNPEARDFVEWQAHDFSMRGLSGLDSVVLSGLGHAASFLGSDSLPVIHGARIYYDEEGFVVGSVNATEHSVMCVGTGFYIQDKNLEWQHYGEAEKEVFKQLLLTFPTGILSVVSDTWDLWKVIMEYLRDPEINSMILARDGKLVLRPDSGDPADIICGTPQSTWTRDTAAIPVQKGVVELLWDIFGGTTNPSGFKVLDEHIGCIYGDSITLDRQRDILSRLQTKGFASTNIVLGVGSFTYQYNTRDTFGFAMKATYAEVSKGETVIPLNIFKDPITDDGTKKSAKGLLRVDKDGESYKLVDEVSWLDEDRGELITIFKDGAFFNITTLTKIRAKLAAHPELAIA